jgi:hypothetical protein
MASPTDNIDLHLVDEKNTTVLHCLAKQRDVDLFDDITTTAEMILEVRRPVWYGVSKEVVRQPQAIYPGGPLLKSGRFRGRRPQRVEWYGMAGCSGTLGSPWINDGIRAWRFCWY